MVPTVTDGDCGVDVQSIMLGVPRTRRFRDLLRTELCDFAIRHVGNRALIACLFAVGDLSDHIGLFELAAAGAQMLVNDPQHGDDDGDEAHHGDGVLAKDQRTFSDEEISAARWTCHLHKASPESVDNVLNCLPPDCIANLVTEYQSRLPQNKPVKRTPVLLTRDSLVNDRINAGKHFFEFCRKKYGDLPTFDLDRLRDGSTLYGWFPEYMKTCPSVNKLVESNGPNKYKSVLRIYQNALQSYLSPNSVVTESDSAVAEYATAEDATANDNVLARHRTLTPRIEQQYFSTRLTFQRNWKRRRQEGAGRPRNAMLIREMLMEWYNMIRHSVDCRIMVRFPKKVLLVKAQMLHEAYCAQCLLHYVAPEPVVICGRWLNQLLDEYRIADRVPNRKYKVPRVVLGERLKIFWTTVAKIRKLCLLKWNYDPDCKNVDQSLSLIHI
mgnify:CR=1 FL=1